MPKILVIGACGQIGTELCTALRKVHGNEAVIAADIRLFSDTPFAIRPYVQLDVMDKIGLHALVLKEGIKVIYHLAAVLSASGEKQPLKAWELNMQGLLNVLDVAKTDGLKVFWPSSIAVYGRDGSLTPSTVYGISKVAGELWCKYYHEQYGVDVRSIRYPGLISYSAPPGGGTTDYAVDIFHQALKRGEYTCFLRPGTVLPMMYIADAVRATLELMAAPASKLSVRTAYDIGGMSFSPEELAFEISSHLPGFKMFYQPDKRQQIADTWPASVDDRFARQDWGWKPGFDMKTMVIEMISSLNRHGKAAQIIK